MCLLGKIVLLGMFIETEQQLQTQKGVQVSSPQLFECLSWLDTC